MTNKIPLEWAGKIREIINECGESGDLYSSIDKILKYCDKSEEDLYKEWHEIEYQENCFVCKKLESK